MKTDTLARWIGTSVTAKRLGHDASPDDDIDLAWQDEGLPADVEGPLDVIAVDVVGDIILVGGQPVDPETVVLPGGEGEDGEDTPTSNPAVSAHLPGQNDQQSHGRHGTRSGLHSSDSSRQLGVARAFIDSAPPEFGERLEEALNRVGPRLDYIVESTGLESLSTPTKKGIDTMADHSEWSADGQWMGYTEERSEWHGELLTQLNGENSSALNEKKAIIMAGMPGAGKTFLLNNELGEEFALEDYVTVNADDLKEHIVRAPGMSTVGDLAGMELASLAHEESSYLSKVWEADLTSRGMNIALDVTAANEGKTLSRIAQLKAEGYTVSVVHADVTPVEAMIGAVERFETQQRVVPLEFIASMADGPGATTDSIDAAFEGYKGAVNGQFINYRTEPVRQTQPTLLERGP